MPRFPLVVLLGLALGCANFVDLESFDQLPALEDLDFTRITPPAGTALWELRDAEFHGSPPDYTVLGGGGGAARDTLPPDLLARFDSVSVETGFDQHCLPAHCSYYVASVDASGIHSWNTAAGMATFLGSVDTPEEAALLVLASGYSWSGIDLRVGAVRAVPDGFELVVTRLVSACAPVQVNRFLVWVTAAAAIAVLDEEVWERDNETCI